MANNAHLRVHTPVLVSVQFRTAAAREIGGDCAASGGLLGKFSTLITSVASGSATIIRANARCSSAAGERPRHAAHF